ncbi:hypothetical protein WN51_12434 [Melipona quadrifasciata]|uniref:Uncharacterized protein n=1 Tax=Melipona quadrifasciata TaxID=166423 RepID=A0A0N0BHB3_9HYME|nr:hypothetical protein WN51_12434 [Melipona quadrifasciata]
MSHDIKAYIPRFAARKKEKFEENLYSFPSLGDLVTHWPVEREDSFPQSEVPEGPALAVHLLLVAVGVAGPRDEGKRALDDCGWPASVRREGRPEGGSRRYSGESVGKKRDEGGTKKEAHRGKQGGDVGKRGTGGLTFGTSGELWSKGDRNRTKKRGPGGGKMLGEDWRKIDEDRGEEWKTNAVDENDVDHAEDTTCLKWARPREPGVTGFAFDLVPRIHCHELCHASVVVPVRAETPAYA